MLLRKFRFEEPNKVLVFRRRLFQNNHQSKPYTEFIDQAGIWKMLCDSGFGVQIFNCFGILKVDVVNPVIEINIEHQPVQNSVAEGEGGIKSQVFLERFAARPINFDQFIGSFFL